MEVIATAAPSALCFKAPPDFRTRSSNARRNLLLALQKIMMLISSLFSSDSLRYLNGPTIWWRTRCYELGKASGQETKFASAFDLGQDYMARRSRLGELYWLENDKNFRDAYETCHQFSGEAASKALAESQRKPKPRKAPYLSVRCFRKHRTLGCYGLNVRMYCLLREAKQKVAWVGHCNWCYALYLSYPIR